MSPSLWRAACDAATANRGEGLYITQAFTSAEQWYTLGAFAEFYWPAKCRQMTAALRRNDERKANGTS